jgi:rhodanese-related sulfurtransferase
MKTALRKSPTHRTVNPLQDVKKAEAYFQAQIDFNLGPADLKRHMEAGDMIRVIDVRRDTDYDEAHIPGSFNLPKDFWDEAEGLNKDRINILYCGSKLCHLSTEACLYFASKGYPVMHLDGGMEGWREQGYDVEITPHSSEQQEMAQAA